MLNRPRDDGIRNTGKGAGGVVLSIGKTWRKRVFGTVVGLEAATSFVESTELDGDTGTDSDEGSEGTLVESEGAFGFVD